MGSSGSRTERGFRASPRAAASSRPFVAAPTPNAGTIGPRPSFPRGRRHLLPFDLGDHEGLACAKQSELNADPIGPAPPHGAGQEQGLGVAWQGEAYENG